MNITEFQQKIGYFFKDKELLTEAFTHTSYANEKGAKRVFNFATFGLFTEGLEKFDKAYKEGVIDKIFTTNLIYRTPELVSKEWYCEVNMCKYVSYIIDTLNHDNSISGLLNPVQRIHNIVEKHKSVQNGQIKREI